MWATGQSDTWIFDDIREQDHLVHHPFYSFSAVETFLQQASVDPHVVGIKMTLYRIGQKSPLIDLLIDAADAGKQVAVLVELKARFDERNNIQWATRLEEAGVHVVYGVENLKTHCKLCLVVRQEADGVRRYAHIGTGNYNRATSQVYTDLGLFTADPAVLDDVSEIFNYLTGYSQRTHFNQMLVAPVSLRSRFVELLQREMAHVQAGRPAHVIIKNNAVTDPAIVRALYRAAQAGVEIDMIVRGVCCLRPGIDGISQRIRVRSVVGRFLEHSRIYYFANAGQPEVYVGSADLMERNLDRRVETLCLVRNAGIASHLRDVVLDAYLHDTDRAYVLTDGRSTSAPTPRPARRGLSAQQLLLERYTSPQSAPTTRQTFGAERAARAASGARSSVGRVGATASQLTSTTSPSSRPGLSQPPFERGDGVVLVGVRRDLQQHHIARRLDVREAHPPPSRDHLRERGMTVPGLGAAAGVSLSIVGA